MTTTAIDEVIAAHESRNRELVAKVAAKGSSLTGLRDIDVFVVAPSSAAGSRVEDALRSIGAQSTQVSGPSSDASAWYVQARFRASIEQVVADGARSNYRLKLAARGRSEADALRRARAAAYPGR